jgi:hypothetical protein
MLSAAESKHLCHFVEKPRNEAIEMLRLRCAALSMTRKVKFQTRFKEFRKTKTVRHAELVEA